MIFMWQKILLLSGGIAIGGVAGYFLSKHLLEKDFEDKLDARIKEIDETYAKRAEAQETAYRNELAKAHNTTVEAAVTAVVIPEEDDEPFKDDDKPYDVFDNLIDGDKLREKMNEDVAKLRASRPSYEHEEDDEDEWGDAKHPKGSSKRKKKDWSSKFISPVVDDSGAPEYTDDGDTAVYPTEPDTDPFIISEESYINSRFLEKRMLYWFVEDDTVTDDAYQPVEDDGYLLGGSWRDHYGDFPDDDPDSVYIRNPKIGCDFEVLRMHGTTAQEWIDRFDEEDD